MIQIQKRAHLKNWREPSLMTSPLLIFAISLRKRRRFLRRMHLMSLQTRSIRRSMAVLSIQNEHSTHRRLRKTMWVYLRPQFWFKQLIVDRYQDHLSREYFRVSRETFEYICGSSVGLSEYDSSQSNHRGEAGGCCSLEVSRWKFVQKRGINIWNRPLHSHEYQGRTEFCSALLRRANDFIQFSKTEAETRQTIQEFQNIGRFPQVVGALDGSHIPIKAPRNDPNECVNRKIFHSIVLQGVADANGYTGSIHDAHVPRMSSFPAAIEMEIFCIPQRIG